MWLQSINDMRVHTPHEQMKYPLWGKDGSFCMYVGDYRTRIANFCCIFPVKSRVADHIRNLPYWVSLCEQEGWMSSHYPWIELAEEQRGFNAPKYSVWSWLKCADVSWRFSWQPQGHMQAACQLWKDRDLAPLRHLFCYARWIKVSKHQVNEECKLCNALSWPAKHSGGV